MQSIILKKLGFFTVHLSKCNVQCLDGEKYGIPVSYIDKNMVGMLFCDKDIFKEELLDNYKINCIVKPNLDKQKYLNRETIDTESVYTIICLFSQLSESELVVLNNNYDHLITIIYNLTDFEYSKILRNYLFTICSLSDHDQLPSKIPNIFTTTMTSLMELSTVSMYII